MSRRYWTVGELAQEWSVCPETIYRLIKRRVLKARRVGRAIRIKPADVTAYEDKAALMEFKRND